MRKWNLSQAIASEKQGRNRSIAEKQDRTRSIAEKQDRTRSIAEKQDRNRPVAEQKSWDRNLDINLEFVSVQKKQAETAVYFFLFEKASY